MHPRSPSLRSLKYFLQSAPQILGLKKTEICTVRFTLWSYEICNSFIKLHGTETMLNRFAFFFFFFSFFFIFNWTGNKITKVNQHNTLPFLLKGFIPLYIWYFFPSRELDFTPPCFLWNIVSNGCPTLKKKKKREKKIVCSWHCNCSHCNSILGLSLKSRSHFAMFLSIIEANLHFRAVLISVEMINGR